jgi:hypothetical protein
MPRQNPYQMDPLLAQGFSSLTKALIGDPETDYQVSRTGFQNAQTNRLNELLPFEIESEKGLASQRYSTAGNQASQGNYYDSQAAEKLALNQAATTLSNDKTFQGAAAAVLGLADGATLTPEALQALALTAIGGGNPSQRADALAAIGAGGQNMTAGNLILKGTDNQAQRGALYKAPGGGKYQNPAFAGIELNDTLSNNLDVQKLENQGDIAVAEVNRKSASEVQTIDSEAQKVWEAYSADRKQEADVTVQELQNTQSGVEAANRLAAEIQWESENNVIVEDGRMVFSPDAAKKYGVTNTVNLGSAEQPQQMYVIDVSPENKNGIAVTIEGTDTEIFLDQQYFDKFNVENRNGIFVIPQGSVTGASKGTSPTSRTTNATEHLTEEMYADLTTFLKERIPASLGDLPNTVQLGTETFIIKQVDAFIGQNPNTPYMDAYNRVGAPIASGGVVELGNNDLSRSNIKVPRFFDNKWKAAAEKVGPNFTRDQLVEAITKNASALGYSPSDVSKILESY